MKNKKYQEVEGDLITLAKEGKFDVITHGCNCFCTMGAGIAPQMAKEFGVNEFYLELPIMEGDHNKLGCIDFSTQTHTAKRDFEGHASSGGNVFYYGNPNSVDVHSSSGGNVIKK